MILTIPGSRLSTLLRQIACSGMNPVLYLFPLDFLLHYAMAR